MTNATVFTMSKELATIIREGAAKTRGATAAKQKAAEVIAAQGFTGQDFSKDGVDCGTITKETLRAVQTTIASGLLDKEGFALWSMDSKTANKAGLQTERNRLTSDVNSYLASFRKMIDTAWMKLHPEAAMESDAAASAGEKQEKEAPMKMGGDVRAALKALILEVAGSDMENRDAILADLNHAESLMTW